MFQKSYIYRENILKLYYFEQFKVSLNYYFNDVSSNMRTFYKKKEDDNYHNYL